MNERLPPLLISTDFDGTIFDHTVAGPIAPEFFAWLMHTREQRDVTWIINTGRDWNMLEMELRARHIPFWPDWVVLVEREVHRVRDQIRVPLTDWNEECHQVHAELFERASHAIETTRNELRKIPDLTVLEDIGSPLGMIATDIHQANEVNDLIQPLLREFHDLRVVQNDVYFRFSHMDFHKGSAMDIISREEAIPVEYCFAAGDHRNDLPMLDKKYARYLACPSNSVEVVKSHVDDQGGYISSKPYYLGVTEALQHYFPDQNN